MISAADQDLIRRRFAQELRSRVRIDLFTLRPTPIIIPGRGECQFCEDVQTLMTELASLNERISLSIHDFYTDPKAAAALGVDGVPATVVRGASNRPLRYFGMPTGAEFPLLIETLIETSKGVNELQPETLRQLKKIRDDVQLQVLVTPSCTHSPAVVRTVYRIAQQNSRVKADVIEVMEFPGFVDRYDVQATPTLVINETLVLTGAMDEATVVDCLLRAVEGKPVRDSVVPGPSTPLPASQPQDVRTSASGLIIPR